MEPRSTPAVGSRTSLRYLGLTTNSPRRRSKRDEQKTHRSYAFVIQSDGSFRVEDITPGSYELEISVDELPRIDSNSGRSK